MKLNRAFNVEQNPTTLFNSSHNFTNSQNTDAINTTILVKELEGTRKIISPGTIDSIHKKLIEDKESPSLDPHHSKKPANFAVPIDSNREAPLARSANESLEIHIQIQAISSQVREDSNTGDYSPNEEVHLPEISSKIDGRIVDGENSGENRLQTAGVNEKSRNGNHSPSLDIHLSNISFNLDGGKQQQQPINSTR
ncbi:hypothetical protein H5410_030874 [Solanum commersonii]|uniref:Uncharacterized protein n=1 Tax=Solanum commersonii TaxID=4109 RepID=A0A9J5YIN6_SOLCO|nr:hypothetical protein H5410_030874 [Solanum commersonii]